MTWTTQDRNRLERLVQKYRTATEAAAALGLSRFTLSRYRAAKSVPGSNLAESALRERISALLGSTKKDKDSSGGKDA